MKETKPTFSGAVAPIFAQTEEWELLFVYNLRIKDTHYYAVLKLLDDYVLIESMDMAEIAKKVYDILSTATLSETTALFITGKGTSAEYVFWRHLVESDPDRRHVTQKDIVDYVRGVDKDTDTRYCQKEGHAKRFIQEIISIFLKKTLFTPKIKITYEVV